MNSQASGAPESLYFSKELQITRYNSDLDPGACAAQSGSTARVQCSISMQSYACVYTDRGTLTACRKRAPCTKRDSMLFPKSSNRYNVGLWISKYKTHAQVMVAGLLHLGLGFFFCVFALVCAFICVSSLCAYWCVCVCVCVCV